uniref:Uncharacterized protein n=1 Tax=uncultured marine virus TaxID=186617 RepID=A0A0F7LAG2_9VIRU|nr:hypothetical protein [uncultured marine virus]
MSGRRLLLRDVGPFGAELVRGQQDPAEHRTDTRETRGRTCDRLRRTGEHSAKRLSGLRSRFVEFRNRLFATLPRPHGLRVVHVEIDCDRSGHRENSEGRGQAAFQGGEQNHHQVSRFEVRRSEPRRPPERGQDVGAGGFFSSRSLARAVRRA